MPWTTLGLDPAGATERDVKRAYAKRLKICRPDQDPEGFRRLHDAYQAALYELQWRSDDEEDGDDDALEAHGSTTPVEVAETASLGARFPREGAAEGDESLPDDTSWSARDPFELSPGWRSITECFDQLESALVSGAGDIPALVKQAETLLYEYPSEVIRWGELMQEVFARHGDHPDLAIKSDTIVFELEHGGASATLAVIERLDRKGSSDGIANLANLLLQNKSRIATPTAGIVAARLAGAAAFWARGRAERLADFAYQHLARGERDFHMQLIDHHVAMASMLALVPVHLKSFWRQRLMRTGGWDSWEDAESKAAIAWLTTPMARRGPCFDALVGLLPEELAASVKSATEKFKAPEWERAEAGQTKRKWEYRSTPGTSFSTGLSGWQWALILFFSMRILFTCGNWSSRSSPPPSTLNRFPSASLEHYDPEAQRRIKEGSERLREFREKREQWRDIVPETPSIDPLPKLAPDPDPRENPLFRQFESGTR